MLNREGQCITIKNKPNYPLMHYIQKDFGKNDFYPSQIRHVTLQSFSFSSFFCKLLVLQ